MSAAPDKAAQAEAVESAATSQESTDAERSRSIFDFNAENVTWFMIFVVVVAMGFTLWLVFFSGLSEKQDTYNATDAAEVSAQEIRFALPEAAGTWQDITRDQDDVRLVSYENQSDFCLSSTSGDVTVFYQTDRVVESCS